MERHVGEKVMNPKGKPLELLLRDLWHQASLPGGGPRPAPRPECRPVAWTAAAYEGPSRRNSFSCQASTPIVNGYRPLEEVQQLRQTNREKERLLDDAMARG